MEQLFRKLDADNDGLVHLDDLLKLFKQRKEEEERENAPASAAEEVS